MLKQDKPEDYVIATGQCHSVKEFLEIAFSCVGLDYENYLEIDKKLFRPSEVMLLRGDATKATKQLGWNHEVSFEGLVEEMVKTDLEYFKKLV